LSHLPALTLLADLADPTTTDEALNQVGPVDFIYMVK
jgi:hypothetical protein